MDRWTVYECEKGHLSFKGGFLCDQCMSALSPPFEVVRAAAARAHDPSTSQRAAHQNEPRRDSQRGRILEAITLAGPRGLTALEVQRKTRIDGAWKRCSELKQGGFVRVRGERVDPHTKAAGDVFVAVRS